MIVERVPDLLSSPESSDTHVFDKSGRFIYIHQYVSDSTPTLMLYDVMFNTYIQFTAGSSIREFSNSVYNFIERDIRIFLPVEPEKLLVVLDERNSNTILIGLIRLDVSNKVYELIDTYLFNNCHTPELISDGSVFGLFCISVSKNEKVPLDELTDWEYVEDFKLTKFTIEFDKIKPGTSWKINYDRYDQPTPGDLHLLGDKLWFFRDKERTPWIRSPRFRHLDRPPCYDRLISYFDLNEEHPAEKNVALFNGEFLSVLQWSQDSLFFQSNSTKLSEFNSTKLEWYTRESKFEVLDEWARFSGPETKYRWSRYRINIDETFFITAIHKQSKQLHRIPLKTPAKLLDIAWICVLNADLIKNLRGVKFRYSKIF